MEYDSNTEESFVDSFLENSGKKHFWIGISLLDNE